MEYASDGNDRVARNLFELGLEHFISIPSYVLQYVSFLEGLADIHNVRALFERALEETAPADAGPLWDRYIQASSTLFLQTPWLKTHQGQCPVLPFWA